MSQPSNANRFVLKLVLASILVIWTGSNLFANFFRLNQFFVGDWRNRLFSVVLGVAFIAAPLVIAYLLLKPDVAARARQGGRPKR